MMSFSGPASIHASTSARITGTWYAPLSGHSLKSAGACANNLTKTAQAPVASARSRVVPDASAGVIGKIRNVRALIQLVAARIIDPSDKSSLVPKARSSLTTKDTGPHTCNQPGQMWRSVR